MYSGHGRLCVCLSVSVYLSLAAFPHYCMQPDSSLRGMLGECPLVVHYWVDLQSVHEFRCYSAEREMSESACTRSMAGVFYCENLNSQKHSLFTS